MKKGKAITLLSIISVLLAVIAVFTFVRFSVGVKEYNSVLGAISLDYDMEGGYAYTLTLADDNEEEMDKEDVVKVLDTISYRLNYLGYKTYSVTALKEQVNGVEDYAIRIELAAGKSMYNTDDTATLDSDVAVAAAYGTVKFYGGTESDPSTEIMNEAKAVETCTYVGKGQGTDGSTIYQTSIKFTKYGYDALVSAINAAKSADASASYYLKITLGDETLLNSAITVDGISDRTVYLTSGSESAAKQMSLKISSGGLVFKYDVSDGVSINSVYTNAGLTAIVSVLAILVIATVVFTVLNRGYGLVAFITMLAFILVETLMMILVPGIKMSFFGVIGIVIAELITFDSLFIIASRIKEESDNGKTVKASIKTAYRRSLFTILAIDVIAAVTGLLIFAITGGGFSALGITLGIGSVISFLATVLLSRLVVNSFIPLNKSPEKFFNLKGTEE